MSRIPHDDNIFYLFFPAFATITEMQDTRNVIDKFKGRSEAEIVKELDAKDHGLVIALENTERDFNMGTIVRSANAFGTYIMLARRRSLSS